MPLFDRMREELFEQRFGLDPANCAHLARIAEEHGASEAEVAAIRSGLLRRGQSFGGAQLDDLARFVHLALFTQRGTSVILQISRPPFDGAGHIEVKILDVQPPATTGQ